MRRLPNPWVILPVALAAAAGWIIGFFVTDASCSPGSCTAAAAIVATLAAAATAIGVGVVVVLALKSLSEWREHADREILTEVEPEEPVGPPTC